MSQTFWTFHTRDWGLISDSKPQEIVEDLVVRTLYASAEDAKNAAEGEHDELLADHEMDQIDLEWTQEGDDWFAYDEQINTTYFVFAMKTA